MHRLIDAMIVGVEKAGTTSLLRYLSGHPDVASHKTLEMLYFVVDELYEKGWTKVYAEYFPSRTAGKLILAKNVGCIYWKSAPERLHAHNPKMKLIVVLRDPVARAYSAYWYARQIGREDKKTFEEAIAAEKEQLKSRKDIHFRDRAYLRRGMYAEQLQRLFQFFPSEQVKVIIFEEFKKDPQGTVADLFHFLGLRPVSVDVNKRYNETSGRANRVLMLLGPNSLLPINGLKSFIPRSVRRWIKECLKSGSGKRKEIPEINERTRNALRDYYKDDIEQLEVMIPHVCVWWK